MPAVAAGAGAGTCWRVLLAASAPVEQIARFRLLIGYKCRHTVSSLIETS